MVVSTQCTIVTSVVILIVVNRELKIALRVDEPFSYYTKVVSLSIVCTPTIAVVCFYISTHKELISNGSIKTGIEAIAVVATY